MQCLVRVQKTREQGTALGCEGKLTARRKESKNNITAAVQDEIKRLVIEQIDSACANTVCHQYITWEKCW